MGYEISKIDRQTCTRNKMFFRRFVRETLSTNQKGWISKAQLAKLLKLDSVSTLDELICSKIDILEVLAKYINGDDILHLIDDLKFPTCIRKGDKCTLFEFLNNSDHSWEEMEVNVCRVVNTSRMFKFRCEDEEQYVGADNILRCLGLYDVLFESKKHEILKTLADKAKYSTNIFTKDYEKLLKRLRMTILHVIYSVCRSSKLMTDFLTSISNIIGKSDPGFSEMIESYQSIRKNLNEKSVKKENIKLYDISKPQFKDENIEEIKLETEDESTHYIANKKDKLMFKKIISFKINQWILAKYLSVVENEQVVEEFDT